MPGKKKIIRTPERAVQVTTADWEILRGTSDLQFGRGTAELIFPRTAEIRVQHSPRTGKIRYVFEGTEFLATLRATSGTLALAPAGAKRLWKTTDPPAHRVVVKNEVSFFIGQGGNVFAKHVVDAWPDLRPMDDVLLTDEEDDLLAFGRALLNRKEMLDFNYGVAVETRWGAKKKSKAKQ